MNAADTAWIIVATALVLFMTLPGLALFYGGLVRARNVLSVFMQCFGIACLMSVSMARLWLLHRLWLWHLRVLGRFEPYVLKRRGREHRARWHHPPRSFVLCLSNDLRHYHPRL